MSSSERTIGNRVESPSPPPTFKSNGALHTLHMFKKTQPNLKVSFFFVSRFRSFVLLIAPLSPFYFSHSFLVNALLPSRHLHTHTLSLSHSLTPPRSMVRKLFNDLVTTLDIILDSSTVDLCVNHPSTCTLTGKVRVIAKRPCVYKSLVLTANGTTRMWNRQGSRTIKARQVFLNTSKEIVYDSPHPAHPAHHGGRPESMAFRRESLGGNTGSLSIQTRDAVVSGTAAAAPSASNLPRDNTDSPIITHMTQSPAPTDLLEQPSPTEDSPAPDPAPTLAGSTNPARNQLKQGVNDIVFTIEFPSHLHSKGEQQQQPPSSLSPSSEEQLCSLPSGPIKSTSGDSSITYTLSAVLVLSRRDILVNNHVATSIPFRVQNWQDTIEWRRSEDHSYHGKRRDKIEFQFQVPKQLDLRRLHELQFGFKGSWRTLHDNLKVKEMQYYIIEEEQQL